MKLISIALVAATLTTCGGVAVAQIASDVPDDSTSMDAPAIGSTIFKRTGGHSMFDDVSIFDSIARYPMSSDPMSKDALSKDVFSKIEISGNDDSAKKKSE